MGIFRSKAPLLLFIFIFGQSVCSFLSPSTHDRLVGSSAQLRLSGGSNISSIPTKASKTRATPTMGTAGKKKKRLEKEAAKGGIPKTVARETQREADGLAEALLKKCKASKLDLDGISADISKLQTLMAPLKLSQSIELAKDWRLVFASDDDALATVGTGYHKLPLTRMLDFFLTMSGGNMNRRIQAIEVLRVLGPFPNIRNTLAGECRLKGDARLNFRYTSMVDGTGKATSSAKGDMDRLVDVEIAFLGRNVLVLRTEDPKQKAGQLVFAKEPDLDAELAKLRVDGEEAS